MLAVHQKDATTWLAEEETVSALQTVERECGTIKQSIKKLRDNEGVRRVGTSQGSRLCRMGYAIVRINKEVTVGATFHDKTSELRKKEVGSGHLRHEVRNRFEMICGQYSINKPNNGGMVELELQRAYKSRMAPYQKTLGMLRIQLLHY